MCYVLLEMVYCIYVLVVLLYNWGLEASCILHCHGGAKASSPYERSAAAHSHRKVLFRRHTWFDLCETKGPRLYTLGFPFIWAVLRPTHGPVPIDPLIDLPKGFSSKMTLEVATRGLKVFTSYKLKTHWFGQFYAFCTKIMSIVINLFTVCKALFGIFIHWGLN